MKTRIFDKNLYFEYIERKTKSAKTARRIVNQFFEEKMGGFMSILSNSFGAYEYLMPLELFYDEKTEKYAKHWNDETAEFFDGRKVKHITRKKEHVFAIQMNGHFYPVLKEWTYVEVKK